MLTRMMRSPPLKVRESRRSGSSWVTMASTPTSDTATPNSWLGPSRSRNRM
jgi:hypothetical protein